MIFGVTKEVKLKSKSEPMKPLAWPAALEFAADAAAACHCGAARLALRGRVALVLAGVREGGVLRRVRGVLRGVGRPGIALPRLGVRLPGGGG